MKPSGITAAIGVLVMSLFGITILLGGGSSDADEPSPLCATTGPLSGLTSEQAANARTVVAVVQQVVAPVDASSFAPAAVVALITAYQESKLRDLANPAVPGSADQPGASGSGTDDDSVGLFQQRNSWGTAAERMDPDWATTAFVDRLLKLPGWRSLPPGSAAQAIQVSARPDAYAQWQGDAQSWLTQIEGPSASSTADCGGSGISAAGATALPAGFALPAGTTAAALQAVTFALAQLGKPYVWDAAGPASFDCSGLTMKAWAAGGVELPHLASAQAQLGTPVAAANLLSAGDLIFIPGSDGTLRDPGHVGMYVGNGLIVEAPDSGDVVKLVPLSSFHPVAAMRHYG
jgi:cell wall-associated NlpC family hydrolase